MLERYNKIIAEIDKARSAGDMKALRRWNNKLDKWAEEYGAYAPIK